MKNLPLALVLLMTLLVPNLCVAQSRYSVTSLTLPGTWEADAFGGVNALGTVAGSLATEDGRRAFVYDVTHGGLINLGTLGGDQSRANDINDAGVVVGRSATVLG